MLVLVAQGKQSIGPLVVVGGPLGRVLELQALHLFALGHDRVELGHQLLASLALHLAGFGVARGELLVDQLQPAGQVLAHEGLSGGFGCLVSR